MKGQKVIFYFYNLVWKIVLPFLKISSTFKDSYKFRTSENYFEKTDIWIHGASGGEAYVAIEILKNLNPSKPSAVKGNPFAHEGKIQIWLFNLSIE